MPNRSNIDQLICPCQSDNTAPKLYQDCCQPIHLGIKSAKTAEALMRSRYSAHALAHQEPNLVDFIVNSWANTSPMACNAAEIMAWCQSVSWRGLTILETDQGQANHNLGTVDFCARFCNAQGEEQQHLEHSSFCKEENNWKFYLGEELNRSDVGRNSPCPCGSMKKFKKCCGR